MNILLATVGASWAVAPELLGFTNPQQIPLLRRHPSASEQQDWREQWKVEPVDEVWILTTTGATVSPGIQALRRWFADLATGPRLRVFTAEGVAELRSIEECRRMQELIFRAVLHGREQTKRTGGSLYLSLAGGRKTLSADLQLAAEHFGCDLMLHVVDNGALPDSLRAPNPAELRQALSADEAASISPLVVRGPMSPRALFQLPSARIEPSDFPLPETNDGIGQLPASHALSEAVDERLREASHLFVNFATNLVQTAEQSTFHALYSLSPETIESLRRERIGVDAKQDAVDLDWLRSLPKAELHCHFGGVLGPEDTLAIAETHADAIAALADSNQDFADWLNQLSAARSESPDSLARNLAPKGWKKKRDQFGKENRHLATSAFLLRALDTPERLESYLFGPLTEPERFRKIGIDAYEPLGDLQGSSLMQTESALRAACARIVDTCRAENIAYCEIRCSPLNCTLAGLAPEQIVANLRESLSSDFTRFKLIFIGSRHSELSKIENVISLALNLRSADPDSFANWFAGFDLAGAEAKRRPAETREVFDAALRHCLPITIHAGEDAPPENIWEAVYELNADRIGHGLTLGKRPDLLQRLRQRRVAIEMCPSSNDQIVGYRDRRHASSSDFPEYPLLNYLRQGLRVTVNTDDPGMSRTTLSREYLKAAWLCPRGLSRWEILQLVRNGFKAAFLPPAERKRLIGNAEAAILQSLTQSPSYP